jgi:hypothetical protein
MPYWARPRRPTTPTDITVLIWCGIVLAVIAGVLCFWIASQAAPEKAELAARLRLYGFCLLALGPVIWLGHRLISRLLGL